MYNMIYQSNKLHGPNYEPGIHSDRILTILLIVWPVKAERRLLEERP